LASLHSTSASQKLFKLGIRPLSVDEKGTVQLNKVNLQTSLARDIIRTIVDHQLNKMSPDVSQLITDILPSIRYPDDY
jgi:hypothetical protein